MIKIYEGELESEEGYWKDVHYYMKKYDVDKETAIKAVDDIYVEYSKRLKEMKK